MTTVAAQQVAGQATTEDYRLILSHVPTSVSVITAMTENGPAGMTVGTFTSVSLDPPLIAFYVDLGSTTWPTLAGADHFGVNVLGARAGDLCRAFSRRGADRFVGVEWSPSTAGVPWLADAIVSLECAPHSVDRIGDHLHVVGRVNALVTRGSDEPLIFLRGGFVDMSAISGRGAP